VRLGDVAEVKIGVPSDSERSVLEAVRITVATSPNGDKGASVADLIRFFGDNMSRVVDGNLIRARLSGLAAKNLVKSSGKGRNVRWHLSDDEAHDGEPESHEAESGCFA
jgi:hypothetical protein